MNVDTMMGWLRDNLDVVIAVSSAIVAVMGALFSRAETRRQREIQMENLRHGIDAQSLSWGNACIDMLNRAAVFARTRQHQQNDATFQIGRAHV